MLLRVTDVSEVDADTLRHALWRAVRAVYDNDRLLVQDRTHERSVLFHIGRHLAATVDDWPGAWRVDLEYNRLHEHEVEVIAKYLDASPGRDPGRVFPDLIIHDWSESSPATNLLVLEAKHAPTAADRMADYGKLRAFIEILGYRHAVFLELPPRATPPRWLWVSEVCVDDDHTAPDPFLGASRMW